MNSQLPASETRFIDVTLEWKGLYSIAHADYTLSVDEFLRKLGRELQHLQDPDLDRRGLFFFVSGDEGPDGIEVEELMFLGSAFREDVRQRIQDRKLVGPYRDMLQESRNHDVYFAYGVVTFLGSGSEPQRFITDLENALVFQNQPLINNRGKDAYVSQAGNHFRIRNTGDFFPLEEICVTPDESEPTS